VSNFTTVIARFNNDSTAVYDFQFSGVSAGGGAAGASYGATSWAFTQVGNSATAGMYGSFRIIVPNYANTTAFKTCEAWASQLNTAAGNGGSFTYGLAYRSTAAISRFAVTNGSGANLNAGSRVTIYGMP
jgi:hypothetical protein